MLKQIQDNHQELLDRGEDILRQARSIHPLVTFVIHCIFIYTSIDTAIACEWRAFWFKRRLMRMLREHDRDMRKMGYKGP